MAGGDCETEEKAGNEADGDAKRKRHTHTPLLVMLHRSLLHTPILRVWLPESGTA